MHRLHNIRRSSNPIERRCEFIYADEVKRILTKVDGRGENVTKPDSRPDPARRRPSVFRSAARRSASTRPPAVRARRRPNGQRHGDLGTDNSPLAGVIYVGRNDGRHDHQRRLARTPSPFPPNEIRDLLAVGFDTKKLHVEDTELFNSYRSPSRATRSTKSWSSARHAEKGVDSRSDHLRKTLGPEYHLQFLTTAFARNIAGMISRQTSGEPGYDSASFYIHGIFGLRVEQLAADHPRRRGGVEQHAQQHASRSRSSRSRCSRTPRRPRSTVRAAPTASSSSTRKTGRNSKDERLGPSGKPPSRCPTMGTAGGRRRTSHAATNEAVFNTAKETGTLHAYQRSTRPTRSTARRRDSTKYLYPNNDWVRPRCSRISWSTRTSTSTSAAAAVRSAISFNATVSNENGIIADIRAEPYDVKNEPQIHLPEQRQRQHQQDDGRRHQGQRPAGVQHPPRSRTSATCSTTRCAPIRTFQATLPAEEGDTFVRFSKTTPRGTPGATDLNPLAKLSRGYGKPYYLLHDDGLHAGPEP